MEESKAIQLLIQAVHKAQARGTFELMESYTLAAAVETASKLAERLQATEVERAKQQIIADAKKEEQEQNKEGAKSEKVGHEAPGSPELLDEIPMQSIKDEKKDKKK